MDEYNSSPPRPYRHLRMSRRWLPVPREGFGARRSVRPCLSRRHGPLRQNVSFFFWRQTGYQTGNLGWAGWRFVKAAREGEGGVGEVRCAALAVVIFINRM